VLACCEERWSLRECLAVAVERGWTFRQVGEARRATPEQLECVEQRQREMGEGDCYIYTIERAQDYTPPVAVS